MPTDVSELPVVNARAMLAAFGALGLDAAAIQREALIGDAALTDSDRALPIATYVALWMSAQCRWQRPHLGAYAGAKVPLGAYQLLDYLVASCGTVGEGMTRLADYTRIVSTALDLVVIERAAGGAPVEVRLHVREPASEVLSEFTAALMVTRFRQFGAPSEGLSAIEFTHEGSEDLREIFLCPVRFMAARNAILLSERAWSTPLPGRDAELLATLERHARRLLGENGGDTFQARTRAALVRALGSGDVRVGAVARGMGMSARKLQSLLKQGGTSFQALLDEERLCLAHDYLKDEDLSVAEVAYMLGYTEPSAFTRAFKRWTGRSPRASRARKTG